MKRRNLLTLGLFSMMLAYAQTDFVKPGSIGQPAQVNSSCEFTEFSTPLVTCWVGQKVLFLPTSKDFQKYGYLSFKRAGNEDFRIPYEELVGKIGTIAKVERAYVGFNVTIILDDNKAVYVGGAFGNDKDGYALNGIALIKELQDARNSLKGKTIWLNRIELGQYDDVKGVTSYLPMNAFRPVLVEDVVAGQFFNQPVRLVIKTINDIEGFVDVSYSGVNSGSLGRIFAFNKEVMLDDPRNTHNWGADVWSAIEGRIVIPGMTMEQVRFFLLQNHETNQTTTKDGAIEQWIFKKYGIVTFINGVVSSFTTLN